MQTVTDFELIKRCAEAIGLRLLPAYDRSHVLAKPQDSYEGLMASVDSCCLFTESGAYDPLTDYAQAFALVHHFRLSVGYSRGWGCKVDDERGIILSGAFHFESLHRAIVECVSRLPAGSIKGCK